MPRGRKPGKKLQSQTSTNNTKQQLSAKVQAKKAKQIQEELAKHSQEHVLVTNLANQLITQLEVDDPVTRQTNAETLLRRHREQIRDNLKPIIHAIGEDFSSARLIEYEDIELRYHTIINNEKLTLEEKIEHLKRDEEQLILGLQNTNVWLGILQFILPNFEQEIDYAIIYNKTLEWLFFDLPQATTQVYCRFCNSQLNNDPYTIFYRLSEKFNVLSEFNQHYTTILDNKSIENVDLLRRYKEYCTLFQYWLTYLYHLKQFNEINKYADSFLTSIENLYANFYRIQSSANHRNYPNEPILAFKQYLGDAPNIIKDIKGKSEQNAEKLKTAIPNLYDKLNKLNNKQDKTVEETNAQPLDNLEQSVNDICTQLQQPNLETNLTAFDAALTILPQLQSKLLIELNTKLARQKYKLSRTMLRWTNKLLPTALDCTKSLHTLMEQVDSQYKADYHQALIHHQQQNPKRNHATHIHSHPTPPEPPTLSEDGNALAEQLAENVANQMGRTIEKMLNDFPLDSTLITNAAEQLAKQCHNPDLRNILISAGDIIVEQHPELLQPVQARINVEPTFLNALADFMADDVNSKLDSIAEKLERSEGSLQTQANELVNQCKDMLPVKRLIIAMRNRLKQNESVSNTSSKEIISQTLHETSHQESEGVQGQSLRKALDEKQNKCLSDANRSHLDELNKINKQHNAELEQLTKQYKKSTAQRKKKLAARIKELKRSISSAHQEELNQKKVLLQAKQKEELAAYDAELSILEQKKQHDFDQLVQQVTDQSDKEKAKLLAEHQNSLSRIETFYNKRLEALQARHDQSQSDLIRQHKQTKHTLQQKTNSEIQKEQNTYKKESATLREKHKTELRALEKTLAAQRQEHSKHILEKHQITLQQLTKKHSEAIEKKTLENQELQDEATTLANELQKAQISTLKKTHDAQLSQLDAEKAALLNQVDELKQKLSEFSIESAKNQHTATTTRYQANQPNINSVRSLTPIASFDIPGKTRALLNPFINNGIEFYIFGGWPRNKLLNKNDRNNFRDSGDFDVIANCTIDELPKEFRAYPWQTNPFQPNKVQLDDIEIWCEKWEINNQPALESLQQYLSCKDMTINTFVVDPNGHVHDPLGVKPDLSKGTLTPLENFYNQEGELVESLEQKLQQQPILIMRALSLAAKAKKNLSEKDWKTYYKMSDQIKNLPFSLYITNIAKLFCYPTGMFHFHQLTKHQLMTKFFPFLLDEDTEYLKNNPVLEQFILAKLQKLQMTQQPANPGYYILSLIMLIPVYRLYQEQLITTEKTKVSVSSIMENILEQKFQRLFQLSCPNSADYNVLVRRVMSFLCNKLETDEQLGITREYKGLFSQFCDFAQAPLLAQQQNEKAKKATTHSDKTTLGYDSNSSLQNTHTPGFHAYSRPNSGNHRGVEPPQKNRKKQRQINLFCKT